MFRLARPHMLFALMLGVAACAHGPYPVEVAHGMEPRLTTAEVERIAREHGAGDIARMRCVYYDSLVQMVDERGNVLNHQPVWLVDAGGPFGNPRYPGVEYESGSWIVDDATGAVLGGSGSARRKAPSTSP